MPDFQFQEMFPTAADTTPYRKLSADFVGTTKFDGRDVLTVEPEALTLLTAPGVGHLAPAAPGPPGAAPRHPRRPRGLAQRPVRRARAAQERQHRRRRRAADVPGHRHRHRHGQEGPARLDRRRRRGGDRARRLRDLHRDRTCATRSSRRSTCTRRCNTGTNLPAQIDIYATDGDAYKFLFIAKGGGSANKSYLFQETKALLNPKRPAEVPRRQAAHARHRGLPALPPRDRHRRHRRPR